MGACLMVEMVKVYDVSIDEVVLCPAALAKRADETFRAWFATTGLSRRSDLRSGNGNLGDQSLCQVAVDAEIAARLAYERIEK
jgi:hypothetical protein